MPPSLRLELPAHPGSAGRSRRETGRWLAALCGTEQPCPAAQDLVLAVNEAVSNSIEHAYPDRDTDGGTGTGSGPDAGTDGVWLSGDLDGQRVRMQVADRGRWRTPDDDPGHRGRGLAMIEAVTEDVRVERGPDGTTVTFHGTLGRCPGTCVGDRH